MARTAAWATALGMLALAAVPTTASAADRSVCATGCDYTTIAAAVAAASAGDTIDVGAGTYAESVTIDKANLTIGGAGAEATVVTGAVGFTLGADADGVTLRDLGLTGAAASGSGVRISGAGVEDVTLAGLRVSGKQFGIEVRGGASTAGLSVLDTVATANNMGAYFRGDTTGLDIARSRFDGNDFGLYVNYKSRVGTDGVPLVFDDVTVSDTSFDGNSLKGMYLEAASNVVFERFSASRTGTIGVVRSGQDPSPQAGVDLNLKYGAFADVRFVDGALVDTVGTAMTLKARNDPAPPANVDYSADPARLDGLLLDGLTITGSVATAHPEALGHGVMLGNAVSGARITSSRIVGNEGDGVMSYVDAPNTVDASDNWWGCNAGPGAAGCSDVTVQPGTAAVQTDPRIVLGVSVDPFQVHPGEPATVVASVASNSAGAPVGGLPEQSIALATTVGALSSAGGATSGGVVTATLSGYVIANGAVSATLDAETALAAAGIVPRPTPTPTPSPPAPAPPAPAPGPFSEPSQGPATPRPTPEQRREARSGAAEELGVRARRDPALDLGPALAFVPAPRTPTRDTPRIVGSSVVMDRGGAATQELMAISCPTVDCVATTSITIAYTDRRGRRRTVTLPRQSLELGQGQAGLVSVTLPRAVRRAIVAGRRVRMSVGVSLASAEGAKLGASERTYAVKTTKRRGSRPK